MKLSDYIASEIESNIPIPLSKQVNPSPAVLFKDMQVGDSRLFSPANGGNKVEAIRAIQSRISGHAYHYAKKQTPLQQYTTAAEKDGVRVWRMK